MTLLQIMSIYQCFVNAPSLLKAYGSQNLGVFLRQAAVISILQILDIKRLKSKAHASIVEQMA